MPIHRTVINNDNHIRSASPTPLLSRLDRHNLTSAIMPILLYYEGQDGMDSHQANLRMSEAISTTAVGTTLSLPWRATDRNTSGSPPRRHLRQGGRMVLDVNKDERSYSRSLISNYCTPPSHNHYRFRPDPNPPPSSVPTVDVIVWTILTRWTNGWETVQFLSRGVRYRNRLFLWVQYIFSWCISSMYESKLNYYKKMEKMDWVMS